MIGAGPAGATVYIQAALRLRKILDAAERWLEGQDDGVPVTPERLRAHIPGRPVTLQEATIVLGALAELGVVSMAQPALLARRTLDDTARYRRGVRAALDSLPPQPTPPVLSATIPLGLPATTAAALGRLTHDLRATLVDLALSARDRIVLAAPFWDSATATELSDLLERRLEAGVRVDILARSARTTGDGYPVLEARLSRHPRVRLYRWYERNSEDVFGTQTFHFKAVVIDDGARAYLGSANMTAGGLRSRMELGVELQGESAHRLAQVIDIILGVATIV